MLILKCTRAKKDRGTVRRWRSIKAPSIFYWPSFLYTKNKSTYYTAKPTAGKSCVTGSDGKRSWEAKGESFSPVLWVAGLPLREVLLHRVPWHVPGEHLSSSRLIERFWYLIGTYIIERVALVSPNPEASGTVSSKVVQVHHVHLFVKPWQDEFSLVADWRELLLVLVFWTLKNQFIEEL